MKLRLRTVSLWLVVLAILLGLGAFAIRHRGERALERKLAELRAKGEKLTVRELFGAPTAEDAQHHAQFNRVLGQLPGAPSWASTVNRMKLLEPGRARVIWSYAGGVADGAKSDSFLTTWDAAAQDIHAIREVLDQLLVELADPPRTAGGDYEIYPTPTHRPNYVRLRSATQWLSGATLVAMQQRDTGGALTNLTALLNLSQAYRDDPTLVAHMVRVAISGMGMATAWDALQDGSWTEPQLAALQVSVQHAQATADPARGIEGDRVVTFGIGNNWRLRRAPTALGAIWNTKVPQGLAPVVNGTWRGVLAPRDLAGYLDEMQVRVDIARSLRNGAPWPKVAAELKAHHQPDTTFSEWSRTYLTPFSHLAMPNMDNALLSIVRNETLRQMTLAAIAIRRYELRHGRPPASLDALVPALLPKLPHDSFSGQPLRYRVTGDGSYVLYSVGLDGKDDGGDTTPTAPAKSWTIWDSPDAVWPKPLEE